MSLRRFFAVVFLPVILGTLLALGIAIGARAEGWSWATLAPHSASQSGESAPGVKKDDSQLTVVGEQANSDNDFVLDTASNKLKRKSPSFWTKLMHPSMWFSKSKK